MFYHILELMKDYNPVTPSNSEEAVRVIPGLARFPVNPQGPGGDISAIVDTGSNSGRKIGPDTSVSASLRVAMSATMSAIVCLIV